MVVPRDNKKSETRGGTDRRWVTLKVPYVSGTKSKEVGWTKDFLRGFSQVIDSSGRSVELPYLLSPNRNPSISVVFTSLECIRVRMLGPLLPPVSTHLTWVPGGPGAQDSVGGVVMTHTTVPHHPHGPFVGGPSKRVSVVTGSIVSGTCRIPIFTLGF